MALEWNIVQVPIGSGLDQKSDQRLLPPGKVTGLINGVFNQLGSVQKRYGNLSHPTGSLVSSSAGLTFAQVPPMQQLTTFRDALIGVDANADYVWSLASNVGLWSQVDRVPPCNATKETVVASTQTLINNDILLHSGCLVLAWLGSAAEHNVQLYLSIIDATSKTSLLRPTKVPVAAPSIAVICPHLTAVGNNVVLTYLKQGIDSLTSSFSVGMNIITGIGSNSIPQLHGPYSPGSTVPGVTTGSIGHYNQDSCASTGSSGLLYIAYGAKLGPNLPSQLIIDAVRPAATLAGAAFDGLTASYVITPPSGGYVESVGIDCINIGNSADHVAAAYQYVHFSGSIEEVAVAELLTFNSAFFPASNPTVIYSGSATRNSGDASNQFAACGVAYRDRRHAAVTFNTETIELPSASIMVEPRGWAQLCNMDLLANGGAMVTTPPRNCWYAPFVTKPFWVDDPSVDGGRRAFAMSCLNLDLQGIEVVFDLGMHDYVSSPRVLQPVATISPRLISAESNLNVGGMQTAVVSNGSGSWLTLGQAVQDASTDPPRTGIQLITLDFNPLQHFEWQELGENLHLSAGVPEYFDGLATGEIGFHQYPQQRQAFFVPDVYHGTALAPGVYQYAITYEWFDARGQWHQSAPSVQRSVTTTGANSFVSIFIPNLCVTDRNVVPVSGSQAFPQAVVWRSTVGGSVLHRVTPETGVENLYCYPTASSLRYYDTRFDDASSSDGLAAQAVLYTAGGVLANFNPPSARLACSHAQRLWLAGMDNPKQLWYSQQVVENDAISFNDQLSFNVDDGEAITAILGMDDKMIIFKQDRLFAVSGQGPNALGQQNDLTPPIPIPSDVGCSNHRSVVLTPDGIMFQSTIGIMLLTRALEVINVGHPVTDLLASYPTITSAVIHPTQSQVRFTCLPASGITTGSYTPGTTLVYDYLAKAWSSFSIKDMVHGLTGSGMTSAVVHAGNYTSACASSFHLSGATGTTMREDRSSYFDRTPSTNHYVPMTVETAWVSTNDIQGFQRVKRFQVLGQAFDSCQLTLSYATDYSPTYHATASFLLTTSASLGGTPNASFQVHVGDQRCEAIRIKVVDDIPESATDIKLVDPLQGQGLNLTRVGLIAGTKSGMQKLPPANRS